MAATIMMPQQIDAAIKEMCSDAMGQAIAVLAEKYGFDAECVEAAKLVALQTHMRVQSAKKDVKSRGRWCEL